MPNLQFIKIVSEILSHIHCHNNLSCNGIPCSIVARHLLKLLGLMDVSVGMNTGINKHQQFTQSSRWLLKSFVFGVQHRVCECVCVCVACSHKNSINKKMEVEDYQSYFVVSNAQISLYETTMLG